LSNNKGIDISIVNGCFWPLAAIGDADILTNSITAFCRIAELRDQGSRMAASGHKRPFEQANKCSECASFVMVIASIEGPAVIQTILSHLDGNASSAATALLPDCRASPSLPMGLFD
jgi:hypothetical protein